MLLLLAALLVALLPSSALAQSSDSLVVAADEPFGVTINGSPVALAISTATVDHITLNSPVVQQLAIRAAPRDMIANLYIGGVVARAGRHGKGNTVIGDRFLRQELYWFPPDSPLPADGTIGPFAMPWSTVSVIWGAGETKPHVWPLIGSIDRASYGVASIGSGRDAPVFVLGVDVRIRRALPLVTASTGADLAEVLGGQLVGAPWQEEIMLGVYRPVRRLQLDRPLVIGPMSFDAVAVRIGGARDGTVWLAPDQKALRDADEDPAEALVRGRTAVRRGVARMIVLSRNHLETGGCTGLTIAKRERRFILDCVDPATPGGPAPLRSAGLEAGDTAAVPLLAAEIAPLSVGPEPRLAADGWLDVAADALIPMRVAGEPVELMITTGTLAALHLEEAMAARLKLTRSAQIGFVQYSGRTVQDANGREVGVRLAGRSGTAMAVWVPASIGKDYAARDGRIDFSVLPFRRVRVSLPTAPAATAQTPTLLQLPLVEALETVSASGLVRLPGLRPFALIAEVRDGWRLPVVTMALAADLAKRLGGRLEGEAWEETSSFGVTRRWRRLVLDRPLVIGPLRLHALAVDFTPVRDGATRLSRRQRPLREADADPSEILVYGRSGGGQQAWWLMLSRATLEEQGCVELALDQPARAWQLRCSGPPPG